MRKFLLPILLCTKLLAQECDDSRWSFAGEWLYVMPSFDQSEWLWNGTTLFDGASFISSRQGELQKYYSAFRLEGNYRFCNECNDLVVRYTNFRHSYSDSIDVAVGSAIFGLAGSNRIDQNARMLTNFDRDYNYYTIEGLVGFRLPEYACIASTVACGIKFAHLHIKETAAFVDVTDPTPENTKVNENMRAWGVGPVLSYDGGFQVWRCFTLTTRLLIGMLACESASEMTQQGQLTAAQNGLTAFIQNDPKLWHVIPTTQARLGLNYCNRLSFWCFNFGADLEGGYELLKESRMVSRITTFDDANGGYSVNGWSDFTLNGPYVRLNLSY